MCGKMDLGCYIQDGFQSVATSAMDQLQQAITEGALNTLNAMTFWLKPEAPNLLGTEHGDSWTNSGTVEFLQSKLLSVTAAVFVVAVLVAGMRIAWEQRARPLQELLKAVVTFVVVGAAGTATLQVLATWSDGFSVYVVDQVAGDMKLNAAFGGTSPHELFASAMPGFVAIMTGLAVIVASAVQIVLMLIRSAMLVLLAGAFPLAAAATNTEIGRNWFKKFCGWSLAFVAYKPAAALVYAAAMKMAQDQPSSASAGVVQAMGGMMMLLLAIFALPALMRFMVPVTAAVAGGSAGMGSSVADPGGMATGAINIGSSGAGFGGGRGAGSSAGGAGAGAGGATGAQTVGAGAKAAGAIAGPAGIGLAAARKAGGSLAGAAAHSAGESGGGAITPSSARGPMSGRSGSRSHRSNPPAHQRTPEPVGPTGSG
jgi:type IV secretion system protein TrbL